MVAAPNDATRTCLASHTSGHLHVGQEEHSGERAPTNARLVREAVALAEEIGRPVASASEAASLLGLPAGSQRGEEVGR